MGTFRKFLLSFFGWGAMVQAVAPNPALGADISYRNEGRFRGIYIEGEIKGTARSKEWTWEKAK